MAKLLEQIHAPQDLHGLTIEQLTALAAELRTYIIETVARTGGHLAPSLGTIELTLALFSVFDLPQDKVVWDVGHQAYAHKILTGRRDAFRTLRQYGGLTGFPCRAESPYDAFGVGHSSTSVSAALGIALARDVAARKEHVIAVIGDGAMTGGESFEGLNHAGDLGTRLIVVLNDNGMSIDENVGAMSEYLSRIRIMPQYYRAKKEIEDWLRSIPHIGETVVKTAEHIKDGVRTALVPGAHFEELGFKYIGPLDGHDLTLLQEVFRDVRDMEGPVLVHVRTKKGRGYKPAEQDPDVFHGVGKFDVATGQVLKKVDEAPSYTTVFGSTIVELAKVREDLVAITAAMPGGTGLHPFASAYPKRYFDVGIAEEHAVTMAAGMATAGLHPIVAIYSTFMQRAYDQLLHDVCLQNLPVTVCLDRAGLVGDDGPTHHGAFDLAYLRNMPNMTIMVPKDEAELQAMLKTAIDLHAPSAIRYPRGAGRGVPLHDVASLTSLSIGKAEVLRAGSDRVDVGILAVGSMVAAAEETATRLAQNGITAEVVNMRFVKPLDIAQAQQTAAKAMLLVTMEENVLAGGFGSAVLESLADAGIVRQVLRFGLPDDFVPPGAKELLLARCGLTPPQMADAIRAKLVR